AVKVKVLPVGEVPAERKPVPLIYTNQIYCGFTDYDLQINLYLFRGIEKDQPAFAELIATVAMSPQHAKAFLRVLKLAVDAWEKHQKDRERSEPPSAPSPIEPVQQS